MMGQPVFILPKKELCQGNFLSEDFEFGGILEVFLDGTEFRSANKGRAVVLREFRGDLDFEIDLTNQAGEGVAVHALHNADAFGG